uniref:ANK_REP_REGION domain-containing protein n=1 Tax=Lates calcarifer TaxID=8187 RepID=A0A4W6C7Z6_LATCA
RDDDIRALMASGAAFSTDWLGSSPLHLAALYSHHSTMGVLLGCCSDSATAASVRSVAAVGVLLLDENSANINAKDIPKMTALCGADVHCLSKFDNTPFNIAMATSNTELMILPTFPPTKALHNRGVCGPSGATLEVLVSLLPKKTSQLLSSVKSEDAMAAESVETTVQHEVGDGGQRVIITVMDQYGNLQLAALGQQFIVTLQEQHTNTITEEVVVEEPQQPRPTHRRKTDLTAIPISTNNNVSQ